MSTLTKNGLTETQAAQFERDGYCVLSQIFTPSEIEQVRDAFMAQAQDGPIEGLSDIGNYKDDDPLRFYPRMMHPHLHRDLPVGSLAHQMMLEARLEGPLTDMMHDEPVAVQSMFYFKPPGARGQDFHQDNFYLRVKPGTCYAAWIAVDDADEENGGMMVVPGSSHLDIVCPQASDATLFFTHDHVPIPEGLHPETILLKAGDVLFFNGSLIHGSYPNTSTDRFRRSLIFHYVPRYSQELSHWYKKPLTFDGQELLIPLAAGGGPCGTSVEPSAPH